MLAGEIDPSVFIDSSLHLTLYDESFQVSFGQTKGEGGGHGGPSRSCCLSLSSSLMMATTYVSSHHALTER